MAEGCQANPVKQLLPCCVAPTTIQIRSWLQAICMLSEWHSSRCSLCASYNPCSCLMSILLWATGQKPIQMRKKRKKDAPTRRTLFIFAAFCQCCSCSYYWYYHCTSNHLFLLRMYFKVFETSTFCPHGPEDHYILRYNYIPLTHWIHPSIFPSLYSGLEQREKKRHLMAIIIVLTVRPVFDIRASNVLMLVTKLASRRVYLRHMQAKQVNTQ